MKGAIQIKFYYFIIIIIKRFGGYTSELFLDEDRIVIVSKEPTNLGKVVGRKEWLKWWKDTLPILTDLH